MEKLLRGDHPVLVALRSQFAEAQVHRRDFTGTGFMTECSLSAETSRATTKENVVIGDVAADVQGLPHGSGFLLFVSRGRLDSLEGYSHDAVWAVNATLLRTFYVHPEAPGHLGLVETTERDLAWALRDAL